MTQAPVFHVCPRAAWEDARAQGEYAGSAQDRADGFIHLSDRDQVAGVLAMFFQGTTDLVLLTIDPAALGDALRWEDVPDVGVFPHFHAALPIAAVLRVDDLPLGPEGRHLLPAHVAGDGGGDRV